MDTLDKQIAAYEAREAQLERDYDGRWVVFHDEQLAGDYGSFEAAAVAALERFERGSYMIREVGAPPRTLPASLQFRRAHGRG